MSSLVLIPARLASTRLPRKPLEIIAGEAMIVHVLRRAEEAGVGPVVVATDSQEIMDVVEAAGGKAVLTWPGHPSGSDRIFEALELLKPDPTCDRIVNVQGDLPTIDAASIKTAVSLLDDPAVAIGTLGALIKSKREEEDRNVVKAITEGRGSRRRAKDFVRTLPASYSGDKIHHIGLYVWRRSALKDFVHLPASKRVREMDQKLEQLRALDAGMRIDIALVDAVPLGVDTEHDLERARDILKAHPL